MGNYITLNDFVKLLEIKRDFEILFNACKIAKEKGCLNYEVEAVFNAICGKDERNESV